MHAQRVGIFASLAVHAACLSLLLLLPAANLKPVKTFQINFERIEALSSDATAIADPARPSPGKAMRNNISRDATPPLRREGLRNNERQGAPVMDKMPQPSVAKVEPATTHFQEVRQGAAFSGTVDAKMTGKGAGAGNPPSGPAGTSAVVETRFGAADAPRFIHRELPVYPRLARRMEKEGKVVLRLFIDHTGKVLNIEVVEPGAYGFSEAAVAAIKKSSFAPARRQGSNIAARALLSVRFNLER